LQDAAERGRLSDDTYVTLRRGLGLGSGLHLALCLGRLFGTDISSRVGLHMFFPGALAVRYRNHFFFSQPLLYFFKTHFE
jgi:hypothetical protein